MDDSTITFVVLGAAVVLFVWDGLPVAIVAIGVALSLWATGVLDIEQALAGFGDPTVIFIASLFVVSEGLDASGVTAWVGQELVARAGDSRTRLIVLTMLLVALLTALINVNGAVAALVPVAVVMAVRLGRSPSQLLLPLAFGAHAGSLLALTGTPVNVIVSDAAADAGVGRFAFLEFALVGVPLLIGVIAIVVLFGERLLPQRTPRSIAPDFSDHARTLIEQYELDHATDALLTRGVRRRRGRGPAAVGADRRHRVSGDGHAERRPRDPRRAAAGARTSGRGRACSPRATRCCCRGAGPRSTSSSTTRAPRRRRARARPPAGGSARAGRQAGARCPRRDGDPARHRRRARRGRGPARRLCARRARRADRRAGAARHLVDDGRAGRRHDLALDGDGRTGAAETLADALVGIVGDAGPHALLLGLFVLTAALGQLISNMATALIVIPIAISAAAEMDVSAKPVLMAVTVSAAASFLTPVATPANLMVMGPGGYRFGDYWKLGLPMLILFGVVAVLLVPVFWSF